MASDTGAMGEDYAVLWLENHGYSVIARNYHSRFGEIDIIAQNEEYILFVEVKTRRAGSMVSPAEAVTQRKQEKLLLTAQHYLEKSPSVLQPRFDLAAVTTLNGCPLGIEYISDIFGES